MLHPYGRRLPILNPDANASSLRAVSTPTQKILIQDDRMQRHVLNYIHHNPLKRGYVAEACHWKYSSARNYAGQAGMLEVELLI